MLPCICLFSRGFPFLREGKLQSQELCWSLRDSRLPAAGIKLFSQTGITLPALTWGHFSCPHPELVSLATHLVALPISLNFLLRNHLCLSFISSSLMLFSPSPSPSVTLALTPSLCIDPKPGLNHTYFSSPLSKEHYQSTSLKSKCPCWVFLLLLLLLLEV